MTSSKETVKTGAIVGAIVAAIPAIPVAWTMAMFSFGDNSGPATHPEVQGVVTAIAAGLAIIAFGAFCGYVAGSIVERFSR